MDTLTAADLHAVELAPRRLMTWINLGSFTVKSVNVAAVVDNGAFHGGDTAFNVSLIGNNIL